MKTWAGFIIGAVLLASCGKHEHGYDNHHAHPPPNGGTLVELNHHKCHLEFFLDDSNASRLLAVAHTFHPDHQLVKLPMTDFTVIAKVGGVEKALLFKPVVDKLAGNSETNSSRYEASADWLEGVKTFEARLVNVNYPGGAAVNKTFQFGKKD